MQRLEENPYLPLTSPGPHQAFLGSLVTVLSDLFRRVIQRLNLMLPKDGSEAMTSPLVLATYTTATRPAAADWGAGVIYVSDGAPGSNFQGSDGSSWVSLG